MRTGAHRDFRGGVLVQRGARGPRHPATGWRRTRETRLPVPALPRRGTGADCRTV